MKVEFLDCCVDWNDDYDVSDDVEMMETSCCGIVNNRIKPWGKRGMRLCCVWLFCSMMINEYLGWDVDCLNDGLMVVSVGNNVGYKKEMKEWILVNVFSRNGIFGWYCSSPGSGFLILNWCIRLSWNFAGLL